MNGTPFTDTAAGDTPDPKLLPPEEYPPEPGPPELPWAGVGDTGLATTTPPPKAPAKGAAPK